MTQRSESLQRGRWATPTLTTSTRWPCQLSLASTRSSSEQLAPFFCHFQGYQVTNIQGRGLHSIGTCPAMHYLIQSIILANNCTWPKMKLRLNIATQTLVYEYLSPYIFLESQLSIVDKCDGRECVLGITLCKKGSCHWSLVSRVTAQTCANGTILVSTIYLSKPSVPILLVL